MDGQTIIQLIYFNPTLVRLRLAMRFYHVSQEKPISIPRWFD